MDRERPTVMKSKSSNNGIPLKTTKKNKKSISDGDFSPNLVRKRGVADRKVLNSPLRAQEANISRQKPPPRPRPGQKKFLASVLSILSKSTTGTQYPDVKEHTDTKTSRRIRSMYGHEADTKSEKANKRGKYKSRILNKTNKDDQFIVLQSMKEIAQTPSNFSEANANEIQNDEPTKLSIRDILGNNIYSRVAEGLERSVLEETVKEKRMRIKDEPETLASKLAEEGDKKLYNLFVDILESTFDVYNLKDDKLSNSNTALEINESVAKKLTINNKISNDVTRDTTKKIDEQKVFDRPIDIKLSDHKPLKRIKPRVSVKSFVHTNKIDTPQTYSSQSKRKHLKNKTKDNLLNIFREELQLNSTFEEPLNLYQALKIMAKGKKIKNLNETSRCFKTSDDFDRSQCILKRRRIISMKTKKATKTSGRDKIVQRHSVNISKFKKSEKTSVTPSYHSLKVYEYNYEEPEVQRNVQYKNDIQVRGNKNNSPAKSPSPFVMHSNYDYYTLLKFPDRSTYDFTY